MFYRNACLSVQVKFVKIIFRHVNNYLNGRIIHENSKNKLNRSLQQGLMEKKGKPTLRHVKYREKKGSLSPPCVIDLYVIASGGPGTSKSILLSTTHTCYLFNCGEGTQRMANDSRIKLTKLENIFITHKSWDNIGGLYGMCLTLEGYGVPSVCLHGPPGVENVTKNTILFAEDARVHIEKQKNWMKKFSDDTLIVEYVPLLTEELEKHYCDPDLLAREETSTENPELNPEITTNDTSTSDTNTKEENQTDQTDGPPTKKKRYSIFSPITDPKVTMAYIIRPHPKPRNIILEKCVELGVAKGPLVGKLKDGHSITLENGTVVHPDQVLDAKEIAKPIIVVECPTEDHLYSLLASKQISECQHNDDNSAEMVVHMTSADLVQHSQYQLFIQRFPSSTIHLFLNETTTAVISQKVLQTQTWLNTLHSTIFPTLHFIEPEVKTAVNDKLIIAKPFLRYRYRSQKGFHWDGCFDSSLVKDYGNDMTDNEAIMQSIKNFKDSTSTNQMDGASYPEVAFLGTGSALPSIHRNVTGILLNIDEETSMILDCGEGTIGQLHRLYGDKIDEIIIKIKVIFISHLHPDHHLGMTGILNFRSAAFARAGKEEEPVLLCAPIQIKGWLSTNQEQLGLIYKKLILIPLQFLMKVRHGSEEVETAEHLVKKVLDRLNFVEFLPVPVIHNKHACGVSITHKSGWKIVYSGDTRPCQALVDAGKDCDLLIHEATFADNYKEDAVKKRHCTNSEAVEIGMKMKAKFILLTHFSQRYPKLPMFDKDYNYPIGLAFDFMKVKLCEVNILSNMIAPLKTIFEDDIKLMEDKITKQKKKKQLLESLMYKPDNLKVRVEKHS